MAPYVIGVCGGTGSGKSTLTKMLVDRLGSDNVTVLAVDEYYRDLSHLTPEARPLVNFDSPEAFDGELFTNHLANLKNGESVEIPKYNFTTHLQTGEVEQIFPSRIIIAEGILLLNWLGVPELLNHSLFLKVPDDKRLARRMARDTAERGRTSESVLKQWQATVAPSHIRWVQPQAEQATEIISDPSLEDLAQLVEELAEKSHQE